MPITFWTFLAATLAICGVPPFAGFMSKDEIIRQAFAHGHQLIWALTLAGAGLTAFYMFRQVYMTFFGEFRGTHEQEHHLHESPPSMSGGADRAGRAVGGWRVCDAAGISSATSRRSSDFLEPVFSSRADPACDPVAAR